MRVISWISTRAYPSLVQDESQAWYQCAWIRLNDPPTHPILYRLTRLGFRPLPASRLLRSIPGDYTLSSIPDGITSRKVSFKSLYLNCADQASLKPGPVPLSITQSRSQERGSDKIQNNLRYFDDTFAPSDVSSTRIPCRQSVRSLREQRISD